MTPPTLTDLDRALELLKSRPEIAGDVLVMAGERDLPSQVRSAKAEVQRIMRTTMLGSEQELFMAFAVDIGGGVIDSEVLFKGFEGMVYTSPKILFRWLLTRRASTASFFVAHNHPTGDSRPSNPDIDMTEHLLRLAMVHGLEMTDHLIIGGGGDISSIREMVESNIRRFGDPKGSQFSPLARLQGFENIIEEMAKSMQGALAQTELQGGNLWGVE